MIPGVAEFIVVLTDPSGVSYNIDDQWGVDLGSLREFEQETEEDLTEISHSNWSITVFDDDGSFADLVSSAKRGEIWSVSIERLRRPSGEFELLFSGVLDLPYSVRIDRKNAEVSVDVFSMGKMLELFSADGIRREIGAQSGAISSGTTSLALSPGSSLLVIGDRLSIDNGSSSEILTIQAVLSPTSYTVTQAAGATYSSAPVILDSAFHRGKTVDDLAGLLLAGTPLTSRVVDIAQELQAVPFPSSLVTSGLPTSSPDAITTRVNKLSVYTGGTRYDATSVTSGFVSAGADSAKMDWAPYKATEPATLRAANVVDDGRRAVDYDTGDFYEIFENGLTLELRKNGASIATIGSRSSFDRWEIKSVEWDEGASEVWISTVLADFTLSGDEFNGYVGRVAVYSPSGTFLRTIFGTKGGALRYSQASSAMSVLLFTGPTTFGSEPLDSVVPNDPILLIPSSGSVPTLALEQVNGVRLWTLRRMGPHFLAMRGDAGKCCVSVWDAGTGALLSDMLLSVAAAPRLLATVFDAGGAAAFPSYVCFCGGQWFVVSRALSGAIPYADFGGKSVAAALRDLAIYTGAHFWADQFGTVYIVGRKAPALDRFGTIDVDDALEEMAMPLSEWHRTSVKVSGRSEDGTEVEVISGDIGDSSSRLDVDLALPVSVGYASAIGNAYLFYLSRLRAQYDLTIEEPEDGPVPMLGSIRYRGATCRVVRVSLDLASETQKLQVVEIP